MPSQNNNNNNNKNYSWKYEFKLKNFFIKVVKKQELSQQKNPIQNDFNIYTP